jgi:hypothetical protein
MAVMTAALLLSCTLVLGCKDSKDPANDPLCVQQGPAFRVMVVAPHGALPRNVELDLVYQGTLHAQYELGHRSSNEDLCCRTMSSIPDELSMTSCNDPDAGFPPHAPAMAILCDVWSNGAAQLTLRATGYDTTVHDLTATRNEQCETIETSDVTLTLQRGDAGM